MPVGEIARAFPISRPAISQHLRILKDAHLVRDRAEGNRRVYELNPIGLASLRDHFDHLWSEAADASRREVETSGETESWRAW